MAAKKRLSKIKNKLGDFEKLQLRDVFCPICQSILIEPVSLPCTHVFCRGCFDGTIENNALCCPLCRLRVGSWLRTATKQKSLVNKELWKCIKSKFPEELDKKLKGEDVALSPEKPQLRLSTPGEIRMEYEAELHRLKVERSHLEQKQIHETEQLIKKIQEEENEAHKKYMETIKQDELLALKIQDESRKLAEPHSNTPKRNNAGRSLLTKPRFKPVKIDNFLSKISMLKPKDSPMITDDDASTDGSMNIPLSIVAQQTTPELVPTYSKFQKILDRKPRDTNVTKNIWDKENGIIKIKDSDTALIQKVTSNMHEAKRDKKAIKNSLPVSLPLPSAGILQHKTNNDNKSLDTGSVDSVRLELCFFKPIDGTSPTSQSINKNFPLKVPVVHARKTSNDITQESPPSRNQYIEGLCKLRQLSLGQNLPSAFVLALNLLRVKKENKLNTLQCETANTHLNIKKTLGSSQSGKRHVTNKNMSKINVDGITKLDEPVLKRTQSTGSINKNENTPKKLKISDRKALSERKSYLRSGGKKLKLPIFESPPSDIETINNNKINIAVKNLSSPLKHCEVKNIVEEQIEIEKMIDQEKKDYEFACKIDAEWNGRRQPRRNPVKRQVTLNYALRPSKKLKV